MQLFKHEELLNTPVDQRQETLLKALESFKTEVAGMTNDQKALLEDEIIKALDEYDEQLKNMKYPVPEEVKFDGTIYKRDAVNRLIIKFLEKIEVEWQAALLIYEAIKYIKANIDTISYPVFDNITRLLGGLKFKGHHETRDILVVNELFTPIYEAYARDRMYLGYLTMCHNETIPSQEQEQPEQI